MRKLIASLLLFTQISLAAGPVIFSGNDVKTLKQNIDLFGQSKILSGTVDPSSSATSANRGSLYLNTSNGNVYRKTDTGSSTNWLAVTFNPMTSGGQIVYGGASGVPTALANGSSGQFLKSNGTTTAPSWTTATNTFIGARYHNATATVTATASKVTFTTVDVDTASAYSSGVYTVPTGQGGYYQINAGVYVDASYTGDTAAVISIYKNGTLFAESLHQVGGTQSNAYAHISDIVPLAQSDTLEIRIRCNGSSPALTSSDSRHHFSIGFMGT